MAECLTVRMNDKCACLCTIILIQALLFTRLHRRKSQGWRGNPQGAELVGCLSSSWSQGPPTSQPVFPRQGPSQEAGAQQKTTWRKCLTDTAMWLLEATRRWLSSYFRSPSWFPSFSSPWLLSPRISQPFWGSLGLRSRLSQIKRKWKRASGTADSSFIKT